LIIKRRTWGFRLLGQEKLDRRRAWAGYERCTSEVVMLVGCRQKSWWNIGCVRKRLWRVAKEGSDRSRRWRMSVGRERSDGQMVGRVVACFEEIEEGKLVGDEVRIVRVVGRLLILFG
jgi:hypothetical protein